MNNRVSRQITGCLLAAVSVLWPGRALKAGIPGAQATANAGNNTANTNNTLAAAAEVISNLFAEETQKWWLWDFGLSAPKNQTVTATATCEDWLNGQSGDILFLYGGPPTVTCHIPAGKAVFFPVVNTECSNLEPAPFYGATPEQRRACAKAWIDNVTNLSAEIDGIAIRNLSLFRVQSGDFRFKVPDNNILGVPGPKSGLSSADGYYLLLPLLFPGTHRIRITGTFHDPFDHTHPVIFPLDTVLTVIVGP